MAPACWILASVPLSWAWLAASGSSAAIRALVTARAVRFRVGRDGVMGTLLWRGGGEGGGKGGSAQRRETSTETRGGRAPWARARAGGQGAGCSFVGVKGEPPTPGAPLRPL